MNRQAEIAKLKARLAELEKEPEQLVIFDGWKPGYMEVYYMPHFMDSSLYNNDKWTDHELDLLLQGKGLIFKTPEQAAAVADAFCVLMELRNQEGAGNRDVNNRGWCIFIDQHARLTFDSFYQYLLAFIYPCFPSRELCERAVNNVGRERVERCLKLFAMVSL